MEFVNTFITFILILRFSFISDRPPIDTLVFYIDEGEMFIPGNRPGVLFSIHSPYEAVNPFVKGIFMKPGRTYKIYVEMASIQVFSYMDWITDWKMATEDIIYYRIEKCICIIYRNWFTITFILLISYILFLMSPFFFFVAHAKRTTMNAVLYERFLNIILDLDTVHSHLVKKRHLIKICYWLKWKLIINDCSAEDLHGYTDTCYYVKVASLQTFYLNFLFF